MNEKKTADLLPCPFCNSQPEWINEAVADGHFYIRCPHCHIVFKEDRRDKVIGMWNTRQKTAETIPCNGTVKTDESISEYYYLKGMNEEKPSEEKKTAEEKDIAVRMANKALDRPHADPDDDLSTVSRQFLRALEREEYAAQETAALREELEQLRWVKDCSNELGKNFAIRIQELKQKNEQLKEVVKELLPMCNTLYVDMSIEEFNAKIENAKKLTGQI